MNKTLLYFTIACFLLALWAFSSCSRHVIKTKTETKSDSVKVVKVDSVVKKKSTNTTYKRVTKKVDKSIEVDFALPDSTSKWDDRDSGFWDINTAEDYITTKRINQPITKIIFHNIDSNDSTLLTKNVLTENVNLKKSDSGKVVKQSTVVTKDKKSSFPWWIIFLIVAIIIIAGWTDHKYNWIDKLLKF